jgi:hypothetical protein
MKSSILWEITPCGPLNVDRRFAGVASILPLIAPPSRWFRTSLILRPWRCRRHVSPKRRLTWELFINDTVRELGTLRIQIWGLCIFLTRTNTEPSMRVQYTHQHVKAIKKLEDCNGTIVYFTRKSADSGRGHNRSGTSLTVLDTNLTTGRSKSNLHPLTSVVVLLESPKESDCSSSNSRESKILCFSADQSLEEWSISLCQCEGCGKTAFFYEGDW